jgi:hypothetical protein
VALSCPSGSALVTFAYHCCICALTGSAQTELVCVASPSRHCAHPVAPSTCLGMLRIHNHEFSIPCLHAESLGSQLRRLACHHLLSGCVCHAAATARRPPRACMGMIIHCLTHCPSTAASLWLEPARKGRPRTQQVGETSRAPALYGAEASFHPRTLLPAAPHHCVVANFLRHMARCCEAQRARGSRWCRLNRDDDTK